MGGRRSTVRLACYVFVLAGCHTGGPADYPVWAPEPKPYAPNGTSQNAFDAYALAAEDAEAKGGSNLGRVSFFPGQKKVAADAIQDAVKKVVSATKLRCEFEFVPHRPFERVKYQRGWRLIGRAILWRVEDGCADADYDKAISAAVAGTRFGFGLTGGGATDASLGLAVADDVRKAIAPHMAKMSPTQLDRLATGMKAALEAKPSISTAIENEKANAKQFIQVLQDSMKDGNLKGFQDNLGPDSYDALQYLAEIAGDSRKRGAYFESLAKASDTEFGSLANDSDQPATKRAKPNTKLDEPWKKLAKHVYGAARPLLEINDATVARTRLLILSAEIDRLGLRNRAYPASLAGFTKELTIDPYSGAPFPYHADQAEYSLYSVGPNGRDDGGDTNSTFTEPDLRLEIPQ